MAGQRWQIRITSNYDFTDGLWVASPIFHTEDNRFGVQGDVFTSWFPYIDLVRNLYTLPAKYSLTGRGGRTKAMEASWDTASLSIRPLYDDLPYETYGLYPSVITFTTGAQTFKAGPDEKWNKGGSNSLENFMLGYKSYSRENKLTFGSKTSDIQQPEGNGYIWLKGAVRDFNISIVPSNRVAQDRAVKNKGNRNQTWNVQGKEAVAFKVAAEDAVSPNVGRGIGYRSWIHTHGLDRKKLTFSMVIDGAVGLKFATRIGYPGNFQLFLTTMTASQQHVVFHFDPAKVRPENLGKPVTIDWFFDWHYDFSAFVPNTEKYVTLAAMSVVEHWQSAAQFSPAFLQSMQERSYGAQYTTTKQRAISDGAFANVLYSAPMLKDDHSIDVVADRPYFISEKNRYGFNIEFMYDEDEVIGDTAFTYTAHVRGDVSDIQ